MRVLRMHERAASPPSITAASSAADDRFAERLAGLTPRLRAFLGNLQRGGATHGAGLEDLVQETLTRAWRSRASFDERLGTAEAWLFRIAFRAYLDHRATPSPVAEVLDLPAGGPGPDAAAAAREHAVRLLAQLEPRQRDLLLRFHRDGRSIAELATETGLSPGTIKSLLHRARARLWQIECRQEHA